MGCNGGRTGKAKLLRFACREELVMESVDVVEPEEDGSL